MPKINLALQGGGAHGAFTWGVLHRLLEESEFSYPSVSGSSAGACNGAALASGYALAGRFGAQQSLTRIWEKFSEVGMILKLLLTPLKKPSMGIWDDAAPLLSPYHVNPLAMEPLRFALNEVIDFERLNSAAAPVLSVNAVDIESGVERIFTSPNLSADAILASACAPLLFQAVKIDGRSYWDGSYATNPSLAPLYVGAQEDVDILIIELTPRTRTGVPKTAKNILNRINELASSNGLAGEVRRLQSYSAENKRKIRTHVISMPEASEAAVLEASTKRTVGLDLFKGLRDEGIRACSLWLEAHGSDLGLRSTEDLSERYLTQRSDVAVT